MSNLFKQVSLGFTPEDVSNKVTVFQLTPDGLHYPSEKLTKDSLDEKSAVNHNHNLNDLSEKSYNSLTNKPLTAAIPLNFLPANPTNLTSNSYLMFGLGSTIKITPLRSGAVRFTIEFYPSGIGTNGLNNLKICYGTGVAPANAAAATGTIIGVTRQGGSVIGISSTPSIVSYDVIVTGLTIGTQYWFDVQGAKYSTNTSVGIASIEATLEEIAY
jgi:hypothetical protein